MPSRSARTILAEATPMKRCCDARYELLFCDSRVLVAVRMIPTRSSAPLVILTATVC